MTCCQCQGIESFFNRRVAKHELSSYRRKGPRKTSRILIEALQARGISGITLLDIGGGVGAIQHELYKAGLSSATHIDASSSYIRSAKEETERQGNAGRTSFQLGDIVDAAADLQPHDLVTLDRVICCYHDAEKLLQASTGLSTKYLGVVYPRDTFPARLAFGAGNVYLKLVRSNFRGFVHPTREIDDYLLKQGFRQIFYQETLLWQIVVYER